MNDHIIKLLAFIAFVIMRSVIIIVIVIVGVDVDVYYYFYCWKMMVIELYSFTIIIIIIVVNVIVTINDDFYQRISHISINYEKFMLDILHILSMMVILVFIFIIQ